MTPEQTAALAPYFEPTTDGLFQAMDSDKYRATPAFNPSLVKLGASEIKNGGARGHITRILDKITNDHRVSLGNPPLPGRCDNGSRSKDLGTVYHQLLLEPDSFDQRFVIPTAEIIAGLVDAAKCRKIGEAPPLSSRTKEWQAFKKENGRDPEAFEQEQLQIARNAAVAADVEFHPRLTEYVEWIAHQEKQGKKVVSADEVSLARTMAEAIYELPENREIADYLRSQGTLGPDRVEVSMFATLEWAGGGQVPLKGRPDIIARGDAFLDPKSCQSVYGYDFAKTVDSFGYAIQAGAYILMSELLAEHDDAAKLEFPKARFGFIAQESTPPFLAKLWWLPPQWIAYGRQRFLTIIRQVENAKNRDDWSGFGNGDEFVFSNTPDKDYPGEILEPPSYLMATLDHF